MAERFDIPALLAELTLEEKASLLSGRGFWKTRNVDRLDIPSVMVSDGPHGLRKQEQGEEDHVGLGGSVPATCFPTASGLGSSWDVDLVRRVGEAIGDEARAQDLAVVLGPGINIKRDPRCGRNFEYLSEDPTLAGVLGAAMVDGIQSRGVGTSLKHYAVNNQETDRLRVSAEVDDRTLREIYFAGFERVVRDAQPWTVMCSYNRINGEWASQDRWLLTEVLRDDWGFDGLVVSDWGAVEDPTRAVAAGLDLEMPGTGGVSADRVVAAVEDGSLDGRAVDLAVTRLLTLLERSLPAVESDDPPFDVDAHHDLAREVARSTAVLLANDGILPLAPAAGQRIALIGELARTPRFQGAGSSKVNPTRVTSILDALPEVLPDGVSLDFAPGYGVDDPTVDDAALRADAVQIAGSADVVVLVVGLPPSFESEGFDRDHLDLPPEQVALVEAVAETNPDVAIVLVNGGVVTTSGWADRGRALLEAWLGGQAAGGAIADLLVGRANPSGRLAETITLSLADTPAYLNFPGEDRVVRYGEGLFVGYRHHDAVGREVAFPFGHGLSYTTFEHRDLRVEVTNPATGGSSADPSPGWRGPVRATVTVTVANTGAVAGSEVVQVYVGRPAPAGTRPVRELRAFAKVHLEPGAEETVTLDLHARDFAIWAPRMGDWVVEPGDATIWVGASSRDLRGEVTVDLPGMPPAPPLDRGSTLGEWHEHPVGHEVLIDTLRSSPLGDLTFLLDDPEGYRMLASFPLSRLGTMMGGGLSVDDLLARLAP